MAEHKAATDVTIAPLGDRTIFEELVRRYWLPALGVALAITAWALYSTHTRSRGVEVRAKSWTDLFAAEGTPEAYAAFAANHAGDSAEPFAEFLRATTLAGEEKFEEASRTLQEIRSRFPDHPLVTEVWSYEAGQSPRSAIEELANAIDEQLRWKSTHPGLFENPAPPEGSPRVRIATKEGDLVVALFEESAPEHVKQFLSLCETGSYVGAEFSKVLSGVLIEGGHVDDAANVPFEESRLRHFEGAVSSVRIPGEQESDGAQFAIAVGPAHHLDRQNVVFGTLVEGLEVAKRISEGQVEDGSADRLAEPVLIESTKVE